MKLNCKPGDIAAIIRPTLRGPQLLGRLVTVLHAAPAHDFDLPDGFTQFNDKPGYWVIEFQRPIEAPILLGGHKTTRSTRFAIAPDRCLRPIRDNPGEDETLQWLEVPRKVAA